MGVKYLRDTLRPHFIKGAQSVPEQEEEKHRDGQVDRQVFIDFEAL